MPKINEKLKIVCAGARRSGSTWLYNVTRILFDEKKKDVYEHFANREYNPNNPRSVHVLKIHQFEKYFMETANFISTIHRDLRDVAASAVRRELIPPRKRDIIRFLNKVAKKEHGQWIQYANIDFKYEEVMSDKTGHIRKIAALMKMPVGLKIARTIHKRVEALIIPQKFDPITQLHPGHITDGNWGSFKNTLSSSIILAIEDEFGDWLERHGYPIT